MSSEISTEFIPGDNTSTSGILILLEPFCSLIFELEGSELHKVLRPDIATFKMLVDVHEPIIGIRGLGTVVERLGLICEKLVEGSNVRHDYEAIHGKNQNQFATLNQFLANQPKTFSNCVEATDADD